MDLALGDLSSPESAWVKPLPLGLSFPFVKPQHEAAGLQDKVAAILTCF